MPIGDLDDDQKKAATLQGNEVAISAGAGSGKTRLLVGRYLYLAAGLGIPPSEIAAITFTKKAADQMKARIASKAPELESRYPDSAALRRELSTRIHEAPISTIHSFCNSILRMHPAAAGIDPLFEILDDTACSAIRSEALDRFLAGRMDGDPERMEFLAGVFGMSGLRKILGRLLEMRPRMAEYLDREGVPDPDALDLRHREYLLAELGNRLTLIRSFHVLRPGDDSLSPGVERLAAALRDVRAAAEEDRVDPESLRLAAADVRAVGRKGSSAAWRERGVSLAEVRGGMKECAEFLEWVASWYRDERGTVIRAAAFLLAEYRDLDSLLFRMKRERSVLDHDDTLVETWRLLRRDASVRRSVSRGYRHVLVDEFQDTDGLQMDILRMITGDSTAKLFTVGDPKQSIYRFRGADVRVFNMFAARTGVDFKTLRLTYRSRPGLVAFINRVFQRVFGGDDPEHDFDTRFVEMKAHRKDRGDAPDVEIAVIEGDSAEDRRAAEGAFIARRALEFSKKGVPFGKMALLVRKGTTTRKYEEAFLRAGVPFVNIAGGSPFETPEARDIANLLRWLAEPDDDARFTGLLFSPFFGAEADILYGLRLAAGRHGSMARRFLDDGPALETGSNRPEDRIRETLQGLLERRDRLSIRELLEYAFTETGYTAVVLADPIRGEESLAVIDAILAAADMYERSGGALQGFAGLMDRGELASDRGAALETRDDALPIITIHKAKGLEYRVVFLADAASRPRSGTDPFLLHDTLGPAMTWRSPSGKRIATFALSCARETERLKNLAESKRLFYVACTRAADNLVISGESPPADPDEFFEKDNWIGWLFSALDIDRENGPIDPESAGLFTFRRISGADEVPETPSPAFQWTITAEPARSDDDRLTDISIAPPSFRVSGKPATLSPSRAEDYLACPARYLLNRLHPPPRSAMSMGERYGDIAHRALERWDYRDTSALLESIGPLAGKDIPPPLAQRLRESFSRFADSGLRREIAAADEVRREERFAFLVDGVLVRGTIDLAARTGNEWLIADFKTDSLAPGDVPAAAEGYRLQLSLYALALNRARDIVPARLAVHFLAPGLTHVFPCGPETIEEAGRILGGIIASMDAGDFRAKPGEQCGECPRRDICKE